MNKNVLISIASIAKIVEGSDPKGGPTKEVERNQAQGFQRDRFQGNLTLWKVLMLFFQRPKNQTVKQNDAEERNTISQDEGVEDECRHHPFIHDWQTAETSLVLF